MAIVWLRVALALYGLGLVYVLVALTRTRELLNRLALHAAYLGMVFHFVAIAEADYVKVPEEAEVEETGIEDPEKLADVIAKLEAEMREAARKFEFERAAELRDKARELRAKVL